ncbi:hypothetical protein [Aquisphaera insulae]|uniref:hypothetical protein n=1 Tax=Aquisphaera insulae TaxID=2712864 RepID=UPI0013EDA3BE|nr:hypothetical protein [Aquisphaera insulae]
MRRLGQGIASALTACVLPAGLFFLAHLAIERCGDVDPGIGPASRGPAVREIHVTSGIVELARRKRVYRSHEELCRAMEGIHATGDWYRLVSIEGHDGGPGIGPQDPVFPYSEPEQFYRTLAVLETIVPAHPGSGRFLEAKVSSVPNGRSTPAPAR